MGTTLHLERNFSLYKFPGKMTPAEMQGSLKTVLETLKKVPTLEPLTFFPAEELSAVDKELLFEHFQCAQGFQEARDGQGFAFNPQGTCLVTMNNNNHIQLQLVDT